MERARRPATRQRLVEEIRIPGRSQARDGRRDHIKMTINTKMRYLLLISLIV